MKLLVLWDPTNPLVKVQQVVSHLHNIAALSVISFESVSHRTMPNQSFDIQPICDRVSPDGVLWIEGGPLPRDLVNLPIKKCSWVLNSHLEPTFLDDLGNLFDINFVACRDHSISENRYWLPNSVTNQTPLRFPPGLHFAGVSPLDPSNCKKLSAFMKFKRQEKLYSLPIICCPGCERVPNPSLLDVMWGGGIAVVEKNVDLRDICDPGVHTLQVESLQHAIEEFDSMDKTKGDIRNIGIEATKIVEHLHMPSRRAERLLDAFKPAAKTLSCANFKPKLSILIYCHSFLNRLKFCLESLARQSLDWGSLEIVVGDPGSPDKLLDYLSWFARRHPHVAVTYLPISPEFKVNRGYCINKAFFASKGDVVIVMDGDILLPPDTLQKIYWHVALNNDKIVGIRRIFLHEQTTKKVLEYEIDRPLDFLKLSGEENCSKDESHVGVLGYFQALSRSAFRSAGYPEEFNRVNQSDIAFVERLTKYCGVVPQFLAELYGLHLWHPRDWGGTKEQL